MPAGFAAIGGAILGTAGVTAATVITGIAVSAVVGAAIGGIGAAIMGGDIGKGMLFGAVGGVVTGGLAGGFIAPQTHAMNTALSQGSASIVQTSIGPQAFLGAGESGTLMPLASGAKVGSGSAGLFGNALQTGSGGFMSKMFEGTGGTVLGMFGKLFEKEPYDPNMDPDFLRENREDLQAHERQMTKLSASLRGGGGSSGGQDVPYLELEKMKQQGALNQIAAQSAEDRKALKLKGEQSSALQKQEYALMTEQQQAEWDRAMSKLTDAAGAGAGQEYQSGGAYEAVLAAQQGRGYQQDYGRYGGEQQPTGPVPDAALGGVAIPATGQTYVPTADPSYGKG